MEQALENIGDVVQQDWYLTVLVAAIILVTTACVSHFLTKYLRKVLQKNARVLPSASIFVNIGRAFVWITGLCILLATCFNINVTAIIAALGIGGIAISLGLQDTLANLIGGLQLTLAKIILPGDYIKVGDCVGEVKDVTWRHTTLINDAGEETVIPNSVINKSALTQLRPREQDENEQAQS